VLDCDKHSGRSCVLNERVEDMSHLLKSPMKLLRELASQVCVLYPSAHRATGKFHLYQYCIHIVPRPEGTGEGKTHYCGWFHALIEEIGVDILDHDLKQQCEQQELQDVEV